MNARLELAEGIQECLETVQDIKACNQEEDYLRKLDAKMDAAEKAQISYPAFKRAWEGQNVKIATIGKIAKALGIAVQDIIE